jgi:phosphatidylinositol alpha-1,6-mannosyltransferase
VLPGESGVVVDGRSVAAVAESVVALLANPVGAAAMGEKGRSWIEREWRWAVQARRFAALLECQE